MIIDKLQEELQVATLDNGLKVYVYNNREFTKMYANYTVDFGSVDTDYTVDGKTFSDPLGIAHYLEHLMFADGDEDYFDRFASLGASSNAYTSFTQTSYLFSAASNYKQNLEHLINMVQTLNIDEARVADEFGVIKEEIEMYSSKPNFVLQNKLFAGSCTSNFKYDIAGSVESISEINLEHIKRLFELFYNPTNATIFLAGNFDFDIVEYLQSIQVIGATNQLIEHKREAEQLVVNSSFDYTPSNIASDIQTMIGLKMPVSDSMATIIDNDICFEIILSWLTSDLNPNYTESVKSGVINETFNGYHMLDKEINLLVFKVREQEQQKVVDYIESELRSIDSESIELLKRKKIGSEIRIFSNPEQICEFGLDLILRGIDVNQYFDRLYQITSDEIKQHIELSIEQIVKCVQQIGPDKEEVV